MKTKLFIDLDGTILDSLKIKDEIFRILREAGFTDREIEQAYVLACSDYQYTLEKHIDNLGKLKKFDKAKIRQELETFFDKCPDLIFEDALKFLKKVDHTKYEVILVSLGDVTYQRKKYESSQIEQYFDSVYFTQEQKWEWLRSKVSLNDNFIIVDDRGDTIFEIKKVFKNAIAIEINRKKEQFDPMEPDKKFDNLTIKSFDELEQILARSNNIE
jgi:FMN phosphatase YigB (HAD superfamily)